ncbi:hypothetical protein [Methylomonas koyamae]|uniref:hypothetical protein n=1 Tax=Methylomonas koyamae TaxID=702114 RepID=UPI0028730B71|nr:hypothetical protein [Methylomonas koyamae]WNB77016.1 hypothetical protein RI210_05445 [Methylomonas koyamae]
MKQAVLIALIILILVFAIRSKKRHPTRKRKKITYSDSDSDSLLNCKISYAFTDKPLKIIEIIVREKSNPSSGVVNKLAPVVIAMNGLGVGDIGQLVIDGKVKQFQILRIDRL